VIPRQPLLHRPLCRGTLPQSCPDVRQDTFQVLDDPDPVAASALLTGEVYIDDTSLCRAEPARHGRRT
jgi:hypothetical protein